MSTSGDPSNPRVSVVIPNWNGMSHLAECFKALQAQTFRDFAVIVVDNDSSDESVSWLSENVPSARVIRRSHNGGFSKAVNDGIRKSVSPYIALLNNDTRAEDTWLEELVRGLDENPGYDVAASLMLLYYEPGKVNAAGDCYNVVRMTGINRGLGESVERYAEPCRVLGACAGAALYRSQLFEDVGLFDEDFFLTSEDTDLNLRALIAGKKCLYVPSARIHHKLRSSIEEHPSEWMALLSARNEAMTFTKSMPVPVLVLAPLFWLYTQLRTTILVRPAYWHRSPALLKQLPKRASAQLEGWRMGWRKRADVWDRQRVSVFGILRWVMKGTGGV